jgi:hypothetical protein
MQDSLCAGCSAEAPTYTGHNRNEEKQTPMPSLTNETKEFIVKGLETFDTPSGVVEAVMSTFGVTETGPGEGRGGATSRAAYRA